MVMQFDGPTLEIDAATIRDFRLSDSGFRFVLQVMAPLTLTPPFTENAIQILPGDYVVETSNEFLNFEALTPPDLSVLMSGSSGPYFQNTYSTFSLHLTNEGLDDAHNVLVRLIAEDEDQTLIVDEVLVDAFALEMQTIQIVWAPPSGAWQLKAELLPNATYDEQVEEWMSSESVHAFPLGNVATQNHIPPSWSMFLSLDKDIPFCGLPVLLMLLSLAIAAGTLAFLINRQLAE
jgi:hypothetical protein